MPIIDDDRDSAAETVRRNVLDPSVIRHFPQKSADVVRRVRRPDPRPEQERIGFSLVATEQAGVDRVQRDAANRMIRLRMIP